MIEPIRPWNRFIDNNSKIEKLIELGLISPKAASIKTLFYKGAYVQNPTVCDVVGIVDNNEIIIEINGNFHSIHPDYLKQMQKPNFIRAASTDSDTE